PERLAGVVQVDLIPVITAVYFCELEISFVGGELIARGPVGQLSIVDAKIVVPFDKSALGSRIKRVRPLQLMMAMVIPALALDFDFVDRPFVRGFGKKRFAGMREHRLPPIRQGDREEPFAVWNRPRVEVIAG